LPVFGGRQARIDDRPDRTAEAPDAPPKPVHTVVFLENFFDYLNERVPFGK